MQCRGWVACHGDKLIHNVNKQMLFTLCVEQKLLQTTIVNRFAKEHVVDKDVFLKRMSIKILTVIL